MVFTGRNGQGKVGSLGLVSLNNFAGCRLSGLSLAGRHLCWPWADVEPDHTGLRFRKRLKAGVWALVGLFAYERHAPGTLPTISRNWHVLGGQSLPGLQSSRMSKHHKTQKINSLINTDMVHYYYHHHFKDKETEAGV